MNQLTIEIKDSNRSFGIKKINQLTWQQGYIMSIQVDWYDDGRECMFMFDYDNVGIFKNVHGNLSGSIIWP